MDYQQAMAYVEKVSGYGMSLGLEGMRGLLDGIGNPQRSLKIIHIAGTNGKGSLLAYLSAILMSGGYRVGRYISPTLFSYRERIQVDGCQISEGDLAAGLSIIRDSADAMVAGGRPHPTVFELETALAFWYFAESSCDMVVLETGLGGAEDATNIIEAPLCSALTPVSLDHMGILGHDLASIAACKAGIIKKGRPVISGIQKQVVAAVIREKCAEMEAGLRAVAADGIHDRGFDGEFQTFTYKDRENLRISLLGRHQIENACLAVEVVDELNRQGFTISAAALRSGLEQAKWPGRFEIIGKNPLVIIDGAHNLAGADALMDCLDYYFTNKRIIYIMGILKDKDYEGIVKRTAGRAEYIYTITPGNDRGLDCRVLAEAVRRYHGKVETAPSLSEAYGAAVEKAGRDGIIMVFGSLSFLGEFRVLADQIQEN